MFEDSYPDTCFSCGLLGIIHPDIFGSPLQEYNARERIEGRVKSGSMLWCLRRMAYPMQEWAESLGMSMQDGSFQKAITDYHLPGSASNALIAVLRKHRNICDKQGVWHPYVEYFDPKWHYEDWRMMELEKLRQEQAGTMLAIVNEQTAIAKDHVKISGALREISERATQNSDDVSEQTTRFNAAILKLTIGGVAIAVLTLALAAIQVVQIATTSGPQHVIIDTPTTIPPATPILSTATVAPATPVTIGTP